MAYTKRARTPRAEAAPTGEVAAPLDQYLTRLRRLGATPDELETARVGWDLLDEDWTEDRRRFLSTASDTVLLGELLKARTEYHQATTTEEEDRVDDLLNMEGRARAAAMDVVTGTVADVLEWLRAVTGDEADARAYAVKAAEEGSGNPRKGVLGVVADGAARWDETVKAAADAANVELDTEGAE